MNTMKNAPWKCLIALVCLVFAGCGKPVPEPTPAPPAERMAKKTVAPSNTAEAEQAMIDAFEEQQFENVPPSIEW
jgi:PBP1b-binding outer membrane lipoprotein LpoB